jgi:uncharacterized protein
MSDVSLDRVADAIETAFAKNPPTICVIGLSGVGKSSTINSMFGTKLQVSATTRGTSRFASTLFHSLSDRLASGPVKSCLKVYDAPGLGEDKELDKNYLKRYRTHLPKCDIALWIVAARNRALALDQLYLEALRDYLPNLVVGINQVDLVDPLSWNDRINMPSQQQEESITAIIKDRAEKFRKLGIKDASVIAYSATKYYNLQSLFAACVRSAPDNRRWMFEIIKAFSSNDWLNKATGLSKSQRDSLATQYIHADSKMNLDHATAFKASAAR